MCKLIGTGTILFMNNVYQIFHQANPLRCYVIFGDDTELHAQNL